MSLQTNHLINSIYVKTIQSCNKQVKSNILKQKTKNTITISNTSLKKMLKKLKPIIHIQESQQKVKKNISKNDIQNINQSKTPVTSKEKVSEKFWSKQIKDLSEKLWCPTETGFVDSDSSLYSGLLSVEEEKSWFSIMRRFPMKKNSSKTSSLLLLYSQLVSMGSEVTNIKSKKRKLSLTKKQKQIIKQWLGIYRWYYNRTVEYIDERKNIVSKQKRIKNIINDNLIKIIKDQNIPICKLNKKKLAKKQKKSYYSFISLREVIRKKYYNYDKKKYNLPDWYVYDDMIPSRIIDGAIQTCSRNYINNASRKLNDTLDTFKLKHKTKKDLKQSIVLFKDTISKKGFNVSYLGDMKKNNIFKKIKHDCRLQYIPTLDIFKLVIPFDKKSDKQTPLTDVIALDPGSRTVLTGYSPRFHTIEIGKGVEHVNRIINRDINIMKSRLSKRTNKKKKKSLQKAIKRKRLRLENLRDELHWKSIKFLTKNYNTIMLGDLSTKAISSKKNNLNKKSKNDFSFLSLFMFKKRLEQKCLENGNTFLFVDEYQTTMSCTKCGFLHKKIGNNKIFDCPSCKLKTGRDYGAGRNIYMKGYFMLPLYM